MADNIVYVITVKPLAQPHWPPTLVRLRRWLKAGLRGYGLVCVEAKEDAPLTLPDKGAGPDIP